MAQIGRRDRLAAEPLAEAVVGRQMHVQDLDGDLARQDVVPSPPDRGHAPDGEALVQAVAARQRLRRGGRPRL
jgi:hypothetical protein